jgi:hypothetical protein
MIHVLAAGAAERESDTHSYLDALAIPPSEKIRQPPPPHSPSLVADAAFWTLLSKKSRV